ncbi:hypothetical protein [Nostoc sphaeroides]|uniref:Uncharacterized protein n=1 Tax=Nostoc sphaeroides CCNUC1 TaxID=2653204 RepID=A0A5P8WE33_9NOSO|nr:hypothetical protein [Nostoc sphaeroides]QFS51018.1 hypothetical protein GXM_08512 [Nostoc sphaeroides CCNUC1]
MKDRELSISIINSIDKSSIIELTSDLSEIIIDATIESKILADIPIFGSLIKLSKIGSSVSNYLYSKKIYTFLKELSKIPEQQRKAFTQKLADENEQVKIGERLLLLIDKLDEIDKSKLLAKTLGAFIQEKITKREFNLISQAILQLNTEYIEELVHFYLFNNTYIDPSSVDHFYNCGFISLAGEGAGVPMGGYRKNHIGEKFVNEILKLSKIEILNSIFKIVLYFQSQEELNDSRKYITRIMSINEVQEFLSQFDENYILCLSITGYQIFGKNRAWIIRYVGNNKYQHIVEINNS